MIAVTIIFFLLYPFLGEHPRLKANPEATEVFVMACTVVLAVAVFLLNVMNGGNTP